MSSRLTTTGSFVAPLAPKKGRHDSLISVIRNCMATSTKTKGKPVKKYPSQITPKRLLPAKQNVKCGVKKPKSEVIRKSLVQVACEAWAARNGWGLCPITRPARTFGVSMGYHRRPRTQAA